MSCCTQMKKRFFCLLLLVSTVFEVISNNPMMPKADEMQKAQLAAMMASKSRRSELDCEDDCENELKLRKLCVNKVDAKCIDVKKLNAGQVCADESVNKKLCADESNLKKVCTDQLNATSACIGDLKVSGLLCTNDLNLKTACANSLVAVDICATNTLRANVFEQCGRYRATATYFNDTIYTLDNIINFDDVLDDPNGNISFAPTAYNAPKSGYYIVTLQVDANSLVPADGNPILGSPIAHVEILVNGITAREDFKPFLTFADIQRNTLTALISVKAGDKVTARYSVHALDQSSGFINVAGTVNLVANGTDSKTLFKIHYLSTDCPPALCNGTPCQPCSTVCTVPCATGICSPCVAPCPKLTGCCR